MGQGRYLNAADLEFLTFAEYIKVDALLEKLGTVTKLCAKLGIAREMAHTLHDRQAVSKRLAAKLREKLAQLNPEE